jgi:hypothetical protein
MAELGVMLDMVLSGKGLYRLAQKSYRGCVLNFLFTRQQEFEQAAYKLNS